MSASDEAKKALEGVTPGPWRHAQEAVDPEWSVVTTSGGVVIANINDRADRHPNACFIAWAREGVPALLADIAAKDAEIARLTAKPSPDVAALVEAFEHLLNNYLLDEHDEPELCVDDEHWSAIHDAFAALAAMKEGK